MVKIEKLNNQRSGINSSVNEKTILLNIWLNINVGWIICRVFLYFQVLEKSPIAEPFDRQDKRKAVSGFYAFRLGKSVYCNFVYFLDVCLSNLHGEGSLNVSTDWRLRYLRRPNSRCQSSEAHYHSSIIIPLVCCKTSWVYI